MKNNNFLSIMIFVLLASLIVTGCGTQAPVEPEEVSAPQSVEPEPTPTLEEVSETEVPSAAETEAPTAEPAPTEEAPAATISFAANVLPIIQSRCVNCHGGDRVEEGLYLLSYDEIMAGSNKGPVIIPGDVEGSLLIELITSQKMPKRGPKLTPAQVQIISDWVAAGAPNN